MASLNTGKRDVVEWVVQNFEKGSTCLDVGACDGKWHYLLGNHLTMDAVEIFEPNIVKHDLAKKYRHVFNANIVGFQYFEGDYDLIIFGDILEHLTVEDAQRVLKYALPRCRDLIVAVPYQWVNRSHYGNPYEIHIQDDLTPENVAERYPELKPFRIYDRYGYYTKG
jgi:uncharacterized protein (DUF433 family)